MLPPPYTPPVNGFFFDEDDEEEETVPTTNITIHAPTSINGSNNVVTLAMLDSTRITGLLVSVMNQKIAATGGQSHFTIQINCGMAVVGDRNIVSNVGLRPRPVVPAPASSSAQATPADPEAVSENKVSPGKRKASEVYSSN
jgi:hypothetical protein